MASTVNLTAADWITNQSCSRLAAFLMASHKPGEAGAASLDFDKSDMAVFRGWRYARVLEREHVIHDHARLGNAARIREKLALDALAQPQKRQDSEDDDDCADDVDDVVHEITFRVG